MDRSTARTMWRALEPYHAVIYFAPEKKEFYDAAGLKGGWMGYFASRAAAMGPVPAEVVIATFYNFHPDMVRRAIPDAWSLSSPDKVLTARYDAADAVLRRLLGDETGSPEVARAAELAAEIAGHCSPIGRALFAAHASLEWPDEPHLRLWHAATLLREFRGDGHVTALVANQIDGLEAHVLISAAGVIPGQILREYRWWSEEDWSNAEARLRARGLLAENASLTEQGKALRTKVEDLTDDLALAPFATVGEEHCRELADLMRVIVESIRNAGGIAFPNPIGLQTTT